MNPVIFNISLIILSLGFILMVIYITIILTKKNIKCNNLCDNNTKINTNNTNLIYDDRPTITYVKMFQNSSVGFGQQDFDANDNSETTSFYGKPNN